MGSVKAYEFRNWRGPHEAGKHFGHPEWVAEHHGFVPHPFWIDHCLELYLGSPATDQPRRPWHECPEDKRAAIKEAFIHFGLLPE